MDPWLLLQVDIGALTSLPGILTTLVIVAVVIFVARIALNIAWKVVLVAAAVAAVLWVLGLLGPVSSLLGF
jgi:type IV secretory pathway VirB6-like protein